MYFLVGFKPQPLERAPRRIISRDSKCKSCYSLFHSVSDRSSYFASLKLPTSPCDLNNHKNIPLSSDPGLISSTGFIPHFGEEIYEPLTVQKVTAPDQKTQSLSGLYCFLSLTLACFKQHPCHRFLNMALSLTLLEIFCPWMLPGAATVFQHSLKDHVLHFNANCFILQIYYCSCST